MPKFIVGVDLIVFQAFFQAFYAPLPLTRALLFFLTLGLTRTSIAIAVPPPQEQRV